MLKAGQVQLPIRHSSHSSRPQHVLGHDHGKQCRRGQAGVRKRRCRLRGSPAIAAPEGRTLQLDRVDTEDWTPLPDLPRTSASQPGSIIARWLAAPHCPKTRIPAFPVSSILEI